MINNFCGDLSDGLYLCHLLEILSQQSIKFHTNPTNRAKKTENLRLACDFMEHKLGMQFNSSALSAEEENESVILDIAYQLCQKYQVSLGFGRG